MTNATLNATTRVAVVGAGYFGAFHYDAWSRMDGVELVGICDPNAEAAAPHANRHGTDGAPLPVFATAQEMVEAVQPDLVDITSPPHTHREIIEALAPHVRHIICQKPFCGGTADADVAIAFSAEHGTRLAVHENFRFQPWYRAARQVIVEGKLGDIYQVSFRLRTGDGQGADAYLARQPYFQTMPRFLVHETAIHWIDTFRYLLGEMKGVTARLVRRNPHIEGEDGGLLVFEFENGATGLFDGNRLSDHVAADCRRTLGEMIIDGAQGTLRLDGEGRLWLRSFGSIEERQHEFDWNNHLFAGDCVYECTRHIVEAWRAGHDAETEARLYVRNQQIEDAVYESADTGAWQKL